MKIAIVTGASSGMGREMVFRLADRYGGFQEIWVVGRRKERLDGGKSGTLRSQDAASELAVCK